MFSDGNYINGGRHTAAGDWSRKLRDDVFNHTRGKQRENWKRD